MLLAKVLRKTSAGDVVYNMVTTVNNTDLFLCQILKREDFMSFHIHTKFVMVCGDGY